MNRQGIFSRVAGNDSSFTQGVSPGWRNSCLGTDGLRSFNRLQKRLGRKQPGPSLLKKEPVQFMAYDLLKLEEKDLRELPFEQLGKVWRN